MKVGLVALHYPRPEHRDEMIWPTPAGESPPGRDIGRRALAVYPSSRGQEACQAGAVLALRERTGSSLP